MKIHKPYAWLTGMVSTVMIAAVVFANGNFTRYFSAIVVNQSPVATADEATAIAGAPVSVYVLANDYDPDGTVLSIVQVSSPTLLGGSVAVNDNETPTNTGDDYVMYIAPFITVDAIDTFTYMIADTDSGNATGTVTVNVIGVIANTPPVARDDANIETFEDTEITFDVTENDEDIDGNELTVSEVSDPAHGTVTINTDGTLTYIPVTDFYGEDSFTYTVSDGNGGFSTATVTINVLPVGDQPAVMNDTVDMMEDIAQEIDVVANDIDPDDGILTISNVSEPLHGTVVITLDNTVVYTPVTDFYGEDSFTYTVTNQNNETATGTVYVMVAPMNDSPSAQSDSVTVMQNTPATFNVLGNDTDIDGDELTVTAVSTPENGTIIINPDYTLTYTSNMGFAGGDQISYTVCDNGTPQLCASNIVVLILVEATHGAACEAGNIIVDFREITYFDKKNVITDWPENNNNKPTEYRVYGFKADKAGMTVYNADNFGVVYEIESDTTTGMYYVNLGSPARVQIPVDYIQPNLLSKKDRLRDYQFAGTQKLSDQQKNVRGVMLSYNVDYIKLPEQIQRKYDLNERYAYIDYIDLQQWGHGKERFVEFINTEVEFCGETFLQTINTDLEGFGGCNYIDFTAGNDSARFTDWLKPHKQHPEACESENHLNQSVRANYDVPENNVQILSSVNTGDDTLRMYFGEIQPRPHDICNNNGHERNEKDCDDDENENEHDDDDDERDDNKSERRNNKNKH